MGPAGGGEGGLKAGNEAWMLEEELGMMQIDTVTDDESVDLGYDEESTL